jgi:hypothetical protein
MSIQEARMADELDPRSNPDEEVGRGDDDVRDRTGEDDEELEEIDEDDSDDEDDVDVLES